MRDRMRTLADPEAAWCNCRVVETDPRIEQIREKVESFAASFPMPGFAVGKEDISDGKVGAER